MNARIGGGYEVDGCVISITARATIHKGQDRALGANVRFVGITEGFMDIRKEARKGVLKPVGGMMRPSPR